MRHEDRITYCWWRFNILTYYILKSTSKLIFLDFLLFSKTSLKQKPPALMKFLCRTVKIVKNSLTGLFSWRVPACVAAQKLSSNEKDSTCDWISELRAATWGIVDHRRSKYININIIICPYSTEAEGANHVVITVHAGRARGRLAPPNENIKTE